MKKIIVFILLIVSKAFSNNCYKLGDELIINGSFDNDFVGFYSEYDFLKDPPMYYTGTYSITGDPASYFNGWMTFPDKSPSDNNKMFLTDASINTNLILIGTKANVIKNRNYQFSLWVARVNNAGPPVISVWINNKEQITREIYENGGVWVNLTFKWNSGNDDIADIKIFNTNPAQYGNDYVIDEISLKQCFNIKPRLTNSAFSPVCIGDDIVLISDSIPGALYYWSGPDGFYSNNRNVIIKNAQVHHSGKYSLYVVLDGVNSDTLEVDVLVNQYVVTPMDNDLGFRGSTERVENFIKLTNSRDFDYGALWLREKFSFTNDFETTFEFSVSKGSNGTMNEKSIPGADGIAFVIQNRDNPVLGQKGGDIGYTGFANSLAVEIDLYQNEYDPNGNHIAVQSRGYETNTPNHKIMNSLLGLNDKIPIIYQDSIYYVKIRYEWKNKRLQVFINNSPKLDTPELEVYGLDLVDLLNLEEGKYGYIGFTSATGAAYQEHYIYNWIVPCKNNLVSVDDNMEHSFSISVNPNPAIETLNIKLNLAYPTILNLVLCDVNGKIVKNIYDGYYNADLNTEIASDISNLSSGVYFIRFQSAGFTDYQKVIIIK